MSELVICILIVRYTYHFEKPIVWGKTSPVLNKEGVMNEIKIRKALLPDLEQLLRFEQDLIKTERPFDPTVKPDPVNYYDLKAMLSDKAIEMVVAEVNDKVIASGYARIDKSKPYSRHSHQAYLGFMYVTPEYRGQGINKKIMEVLKEWAVAQNVTEFRLEVYCDNASAVKAYEKFGFSRYFLEMRFNLDE
jgi:ribosomal protein S18 acetylase RimI-like enzyme